MSVLVLLGLIAVGYWVGWVIGGHHQHDQLIHHRSRAQAKRDLARVLAAEKRHPRSIP
jgi:hypothetical protein